MPAPKKGQPSVREAVEEFLLANKPFCTKYMARERGLTPGGVTATISYLRRKSKWQIDTIPMDCEYGGAGHYVLIKAVGAQMSRDLVPPERAFSRAVPEKDAGGANGLPYLDEKLEVCALIRREDGSVELGLRANGHTWHVALIGRT